MPNIKQYGVLIVEDDTASRERFERAVSAQDCLTLQASASNMSEAKKALSAHSPDILVVDIGLPDGNGIDLIRYARKRIAPLICLVVTIYGDEQHVLGALAAGANGYLQKDAPLSELGAAILSAIQGGAPVSPSIAKALLKHLSAPTSPSLPKQTDYYLTERETEVLKLIAKGYSREEIADILFVSINTVSAHTKNIYKKLEVHSGTSAINKARDQGLIE